MNKTHTPIVAGAALGCVAALCALATPSLAQDQPGTSASAQPAAPPAELPAQPPTGEVPPPPARPRGLPPPPGKRPLPGQGALPGQPPPPGQGPPPPPPGQGPPPPPPGQGPPPPAAAPAPPGYGPPPPYGPPGYGPPPPGYGPPPGYYYPPGYYGPPPEQPEPPEPPPPFRRKSTGMMVSGIVLTGLGGANLLAGAVVTAAARPLAEESRSCQDTYYTYPSLNGPSDNYVPSNSCVDDLERDYRVGGIIALVAGGVLAGVGIPLLVVGAEKIPNDQAPGPEGDPAAEPSPVQAFIPRLDVGTSDVRLRWDF